MRLKSGFWILAYIRTCAQANCAAYVVRHGDDDAGAAFIKINHLDGTASLYGPAPAGMSEAIDAQRFAVLIGPDAARSESDVDAYVAKQYEYDPDLWLIEVEDAKRRHFLDDWLATD
ncbi:MAG: DUF1491 family protein [Alphaproteobacteria bacterium]|nr:DUF1491 family protein [Alphaproteobacteria bacterium]